jgi:hypothetical protein
MAWLRADLHYLLTVRATYSAEAEVGLLHSCDTFFVLARVPDGTAWNYVTSSYTNVLFPTTRRRRRGR